MQRTLGIAVALIVVLGGVWIVYAGRPVMKLNKQTTDSTSGASTSGASTSTASTPSPSASGSNTFTMSDVALHATEGDCWTVVNGRVYDLTTWVARHPGGARPIVSMCGKDSSAGFERKHGGESRPQAALILLNIGTLR